MDTHTPEQLENYLKNLELIASAQANLHKLSPIMQLVAGLGTQDILMVDLYEKYPASEFWVQVAKK